MVSVCLVQTAVGETQWCQHPAPGIPHVLIAGQGLLGLGNGLFLQVGDPTLLHKGYRDMLKWHGGGNRAVPFGDTGLYGKLHALIEIVT